jgi:hypothetical protein
MTEDQATLRPETAAVSPKPLFIDFEASGLHAASYPIEIGWCDPEHPDAAQVHLIRPTPAWLATPWDERAERIHGIELDRLCLVGEPVAHVLSALRAAAAEHRLYADDVEYDGRWLLALCRATRFQPGEELKVWSASILFRDLANRRGMDLTGFRARARQLAPVTHRADQDARYLGTVYRLLANDERS